MEDIDDIKLIWNDLDTRLTYLEKENERLMKTVMDTRYKSAKDKLVQKYAGFIIVEIIMIVFMSLFFIYNPEINEKFRIPALIYWDIFFIFEVGIDLYLMMQVKSINIYEHTINEVAKRAAQNWKFHKQAILIGLPLAFGAIILFALALNLNEFTILGMLVGGLIGMVIGINQLLRFKNYYKILQTKD